MLEDGRLLHANAHHMETAIEPLDETVARFAAAGLEVGGARRLGFILPEEGGPGSNEPFQAHPHELRARTLRPTARNARSRREWTQARQERILITRT